MTSKILPTAGFGLIGSLSAAGSRKPLWSTAAIETRSEYNRFKNRLLICKTDCKFNKRSSCFPNFRNVLHCWSRGGCYETKTSTRYRHPNLHEYSGLGIGQDHRARFVKNYLSESGGVHFAVSQIGSHVIIPHNRIIAPVGKTYCKNIHQRCRVVRNDVTWLWRHETKPLKEPRSVAKECCRLT